MRLQMNKNMIRRFSLRSLKNKNNLWICCSSFSWFRYFQYSGRARRLVGGAKFLSAPKRHVIRFVSLTRSLLAGTLPSSVRSLRFMHGADGLCPRTVFLGTIAILVRSASSRILILLVADHVKGRASMACGPRSTSVSEHRRKIFVF